MEVWKILIIFAYIIIIVRLSKSSYKIYKRRGRFICCWDTTREVWYTWKQDLFILIHSVFLFITACEKGWLMYKIIL